MERRRIQLVAGATYSVSLPKEWITKNNLRKHDEVMFTEKADRTLVLSVGNPKAESPTSISLNADEYGDQIDQVLFAVYYLGIEEITFFSRQQLAKDVKMRIRRANKSLSGTEVTYEDKQKMIIRVLLGRERVDILQILYRISLIIDLSISNVMEELDLETLQINEDEVDRLYQLVTKTVSLSLIDTATLQSSGIKNAYLIPSFFLLGKKLENLQDHLITLAKYIHESPRKPSYVKDFLPLIAPEIRRSVNHLQSNDGRVFQKLSREKAKAMQDDIERLKDGHLASQLSAIMRLLVDIGEEAVNISFYKHLAGEKII